MKVIKRVINGKSYFYLEKSVRIGDTTRKISKYLGIHKDSKEIEKIKKESIEEFLNKEARLRSNILLKKIKQLEYPLNLEELEKIELMNIKFRDIMKNLHTKSIEDLNKRFVANYVFESNALEGNTLTLKNVAEIVFENRISQGKDLREVYDAQNSYNLFLFLQRTRKPIDHNFIVKIHKMLMEKIDDRIGYRKEPIILLGRPTELTKPENVPKEMDNLMSWYKNNENKIYPLELAFKFHAKFEKIHPFCDGNGRVGRFLLNYILIRKGYFPIIIRKTSRNRYIKALEAADNNKWIVLMRFALENYKKTFRNFFEVYHKYNRFTTTQNKKI